LRKEREIKMRKHDVIKMVKLTERELEKFTVFYKGMSRKETT
jgi:hypothetical protein